MKKSQRFIELDFMRAVSALWVILTHLWVLHLLPFALKFNPPKNEVLGINMGKVLELGFEQFFPLPLTNFGNFTFDILNIFCGLGYQSVHIFFVLSGFGLTYSKLLKPNDTWFVFLKKRFLRIYPTYFIVWILWIIITFLDKPSFHIPWKGFLFIGERVPFTWFIIPIFQFYIAFPIIFYLLKRYSVLRFLITMFLVKCIWTLVVIIYGYLHYNRLLGSTFYPGYLAISRLFEFSLGMAAAKIFFEDNEKLIKYLTNLKVIGLAFVCEVIGTMITFLKIDLFNHKLPIGLAICDALIGFGIFVIVFNLSRLIVNLNPNTSKIILFISKFSYELYLCQFIALLLITYIVEFLNPVYPSLIMLLTIPIYSLAVGIDILASILVQKIILVLTSKLSGSPRASV